MRNGPHERLATEPRGGRQSSFLIVTLVLSPPLPPVIFPYHSKKSLYHTNKLHSGALPQNQDQGQTKFGQSPAPSNSVIRPNEPVTLTSINILNPYRKSRHEGPTSICNHSRRSPNKKGGLSAPQPRQSPDEPCPVFFCSDSAFTRFIPRYPATSVPISHPRLGSGSSHSKF